MMQAFLSNGYDAQQLYGSSGVPAWVNQALLTGGALPLGVAPPKPEAKPCKSYPPAGATNNRAGGKSCSEALMRFAKQSEIQGQQQKSFQAISSAITALQQSPAALASIVSAAAAAAAAAAPQQQHGWITDLPMNPMDSLSVDPSMLMLQQSLPAQLPMHYQNPHQQVLQQLGQQSMHQENALLAAALSAPLQGVPMQQVPSSRGMAEFLSMGHSTPMVPTAAPTASLPTQQLPLNQLNLALLQQSLGPAPGSPSLGMSPPAPQGMVPNPGVPQLSTQNMRNTYQRGQGGLSSAAFRPSPAATAHNPILAAVVGQDPLLPTSPTNLASPVGSSGRARSPRELSSTTPEPGTFRHHALQEIGTSLARTGISVQQAVQAGLLGGMCAAEVKILCSAHERVWKQTHLQVDDWPGETSNSSDSSALAGIVLPDTLSTHGLSKQDSQLSDFSLFGGQNFSAMVPSKECEGMPLAGYLDCVSSV